jgi:RNA polymerase sigma-70 factor (ECF subfamily)
MLSGDERSFDAFFDRYFPGLYRFAMVRVDYDEDAAEEVAQSTLCKAISKLDTFRGEAALFTWLCTFCRHEISAYYRKRSRAPVGVDLTEDSPEIRAALESLGNAVADEPGKAFDRRELGRLVQIALDALPIRYGNALEWKYLDGLSVKEIAGRLDLSAKAAESLLTRAREAFRDAFTSMVRGTISTKVAKKRAEVPS